MTPKLTMTIVVSDLEALDAPRTGDELRIVRRNVTKIASGDAPESDTQYAIEYELVDRDAPDADVTWFGTVR